MKKAIQRHERNYAYDEPIHCGYCGQCVIDLSAGDAELTIKPCKHTLFVAHDLAWEYLSSHAESSLKSQGFTVNRADDGLVEVEPQDGDNPANNPDAITDLIDIQDALKVATYVPAPSFYGTYVGFAPAE